MPRLNGTGPWGAGAGTGRGMGSCGGGMALGGGFGRGSGRRFFSRKEEGEILKEESVMLEKELKAVKERLAELKS